MNIEQRITSLAKVGHDEDSWGVGVSGVVDNPSPFPRINKLRDWYIDGSEWTVDSERAVLATEAYQKYEGEKQILKVAKVLEHILDNRTIFINDDLLLVGDTGAPLKSCPIFPEFSFDWVVRELKGEGAPVIRERPNNLYVYDDRVRDELLGLEEYWKGKSQTDFLMSRLDEDETKGDFMGIMLYSTNLYHFGGIGHLVLDFEYLFENGFKGLRERIQGKLEEAAGDEERADFCRATLIVVDATIRYIYRHASETRKKAQQFEGQRRDELLQMADNLDLVAEQPPQTFWQAYQLMQISWSINAIESSGHALCFGRLDQILYPFFKRDLENGTCTREFMQEIIECHGIIASAVMKLRDWSTTQVNSGRNLGGLAMTLGGVDKDGNDATNELSGMFVDMCAHTRLGSPWAAVRLHTGSPDWFVNKVVKGMRMGTGEPKVFSDEIYIPSMVKRGMSLEDARNYAIVGCVEPTVPGKTYGWHDAAYFSISRVLEMAINDGYAIGHEDKGRLGVATGRLEDFESFGDVKRAYEAQMKYWVDLMVRSLNKIDVLQRENKPLPYLSTMMNDCIERGLDINAGGAVYNFTGPQATGLATVADSLAVIKKLVFEEKKVTAAELMAALKANWEGYDELYHLVNSDKVPQFGNDDDYVDELAVYASDIYCDCVEDIPNPRGGVYQPGVYSVSANVPLGMVAAASPDGRKAHEPLSDCIGPVHTYVSSHDRKGPTAVTKSCAKLNQVRMSNGTLLNLRFTPPALSGDTGVSNLAALIKAYFKKGMHMQLNVIGREVLEDAYKHPEKYRGLMVRVAGYSAPWRELSDELRLDILSRTEMSFD